MINNDSNELFKKFFLEMDPRKGDPVHGRIKIKKLDSRPPRLSCGQDSVCFLSGVQWSFYFSRNGAKWISLLVSIGSNVEEPL